MKNFGLLVWLSQLGLSVAVPLSGFILAGVWLHNRFDLGVWIIIAGAVVGIACSVAGFRNALKTMDRMASDESDESDEMPPVSFNDHD